MCILVECRVKLMRAFQFRYDSGLFISEMCLLVGEARKLIWSLKYPINSRRELKLTIAEDSCVNASQLNVAGTKLRVNHIRGEGLCYLA